MGTDCNYRIESSTNGANWTEVELPRTEEEAIEGDLCNRDYALYGVLAGVARWGQPRWCRPVVPVRGFPSPHAKMKESATCHNATWMTVAELDSFDWEQVAATEAKYLDAKNYEKFLVDGTYFHSESPSDQTVITNDEMLMRVDQGWYEQGYVTRVSVEFSYADYAYNFLDHVMPVLRRIGQPDRVRIILWFDS